MRIPLLRIDIGNLSRPEHVENLAKDNRNCILDFHHTHLSEIFILVEEERSTNFRLAIRRRHINLFFDITFTPMMDFRLESHNYPNQP